VLNAYAAGVLTDAPTGEYSSHVLYTDTDVDQIKSIPESAVHREVRRRTVVPACCL
jgi:hypothetical protein